MQYVHGDPVEDTDTVQKSGGIRHNLDWFEDSLPSNATIKSDTATDTFNLGNIQFRVIHFKKRVAGPIN